MKKIIILLTAVLLIISSCTQKNDESEKTASVPAGKFYCPMHPEIISDKAATCSVCGMDLVKK